jgi:hypothetical protein
LGEEAGRGEAIPLPASNAGILWWLAFDDPLDELQIEKTQYLQTQERENSIRKPPRLKLHLAGEECHPAPNPPKGFPWQHSSATQSNQVVPFWVETIGTKEQEYGRREMGRQTTTKTFEPLV